MVNFVSKLKEDSDRAIRLIESGNSDILQKSLEALRVLGCAFQRMKGFIADYDFKDQYEEIIFFKDLKPKILSNLIYYRKIYHIEENKPCSSPEVQRRYLVNELEAIELYKSEILEFYHYYRRESNHLDNIYFLRGKTEAIQQIDAFQYERDPMFSTNCDYKVATILANDLLQSYLLTEVAKIDCGESSTIQNVLPKVKVTWTANKTELIELIYGLNLLGCFNNSTISMRKLVFYFESAFNIELGSNISRLFYDMKLRNEPTPFLKKLLDAVRTKMEIMNNKKRRK